MDKMCEYETGIFDEAISFYNYDFWEGVRMQCYFTAQVNSTKKLKVKDLMQFPWDHNDTAELPKTISKTDIERLRQKAAVMEERMKNNN